MDFIQTKTEQLLFILGVTLPLLMDIKIGNPRKHEMIDWVLEAIDAVIYKNEKLPEFPK